MAATARQERELRDKCFKKLQDPNLSHLEKLRAYALSKGARGIKTLGNIFKRFDKNGDKKLDIGEFRHALHVDGIVVEPHIEQECFDQMDLDGTGFISFDEFLVALRPPMSHRRKALIQQAFNKLDKTGNEVVDCDDLKGVYCAKKHPKYISGEWTEEDVFKEWLNSFNGPDRHDGIVTLPDFENYYAGVSASIDSDVYFDLMMRQAWKL